MSINRGDRRGISMIVVQGRKRGRRGVSSIEPDIASPTFPSQLPQRRLGPERPQDRRRRDLALEIQRCRRWESVLANNPIDIVLVFQLAREGIPNNAIRRKVWPLLLGITADDVAPTFREAILKCNGFNPTHKYASVVARDVERSLWWYVPEAGQRAVQRTHLLHLITAILNKHNNSLHYYQGYHDIASIVLLVCGTDDGLAFTILERLSLYHLKDYMAPQLAETAAHLQLLMPLLKHADKGPAAQRTGSLEQEPYITLSDIVEEAQVPPFFCLSWVLTWGSHVIPNFTMAANIFDAMIASHPVFPIYFSAAMMMESRRWGLLNLPKPYQMPQVHHFFSTFPTAKQHELDYSHIVKTATKLCLDYPPETLLRNEAARAGIASTSILFAYPFPWSPAALNSATAPHTTTRISRIFTTIGVVSITSLAAAATAIVINSMISS